MAACFLAVRPELVVISVAIAFTSLWLANLLIEPASPRRDREGGRGAA
jgi:hypothetical protein